MVLCLIATQAESKNEQLRSATALFIFILHVLLCHFSQLFSHGSAPGSFSFATSHLRRPETPDGDSHLFYAHHHMDPPVGLHGPPVLLAVGDLLQEVLLGYGLTLVLLQRLPQVAYILGSAQFRDARQQHEGEEGDEQVGVAAEGEVGLSAGVLIGSGRGGT